MFLSICNETLGLSINDILDSDFVLITSVLRERNYGMLQRDKGNSGEEELNEDEEWVTVIDFNSGQPKKVKKVKAI